MQLVGLKTENMYRRCAITAERDLREGVAKLAALHGAEPKAHPEQIGYNLGTIYGKRGGEGDSRLKSQNL